VLAGQLLQKAGFTGQAVLVPAICLHLADPAVVDIDVTWDPKLSAMVALSAIANHATPLAELPGSRSTNESLLRERALTISCCRCRPRAALPPAACSRRVRYPTGSNPAPSCLRIDHEQVRRSNDGRCGVALKYHIAVWPESNRIGTVVLVSLIYFETVAVLSGGSTMARTATFAPSLAFSWSNSLLSGFERSRSVSCNRSPASARDSPGCHMPSDCYRQREARSAPSGEP